MIYLIHYDRPSRQLLRMQPYADAQRQQAEDARLALELSLIGNGREQEVVLLDAADESSLRRTHGRYFYSLAELVAAARLAA